MKNSFLIGVILGIVFPILAYVLVNYTTISSQLFSDKPTAPYFLAAAINLIACWISYKKEFDKLANGIILVTFLGMMFLIFTKSIVI